MENMRNLSMFLIAISSLSLLFPSSASTGSDHDFGPHPRFVCTPIPVDADPACFPTGPGMGAAGTSGPGRQSPPPAGWWGASEEAKATILHLRESLVQQKETILDQRETIRELTAKLNLCEGFRRGTTPHEDHHGTVGLGGPHIYTDNGHYSNQQGHHRNSNLVPDPQHHPSVGGQQTDGGQSSNNHGKDKHVTPGDTTSSPQQMERMLQVLKERLENLQNKRNTSTTYSGSLKELLQRKIGDMEQQLNHYTAALSSPDHHDDQSSHRDHEDDNHHGDQSSHRDHEDDDHHGDHEDDHNGGHDDNHGDHGNYTDHHNDDHDHHDTDGNHDNHNNDHHNKADSHGYTGYRTQDSRTGFHSNKLEMMLNQLHHAGSNRNQPKSPDAFQISFPMRTNYMYGRAKRTLLHEIFALTLCLWIKAGTGPGLGTPFSYSAPGQVNELVLIEWGNNPIELLVDDQAVTLPLSLSDGKWHHVCVTWSTRDGQWAAFQDGVQRGSGMNLSAWHPIKPGGVFILGQEQDILGGRFDATQAFVGEMADLNMWSQVLSHSDIYSLASCGSHLTGDVIAWSESEVELYGGVTKFPFDPCH